MIRGFYIALLVVAFQVVFAQVNMYHPFPADTAVWLQDMQDQNCHGYCYSTRFTQMGDTIMNTIHYKKLFAQNGSYSMIGSSGPPSFTPVFAFNPSGPNNYDGALRQDTLARKVYYFPPSGMNHDTLLYDFDLQVGDTLPATYMHDAMTGWTGSGPITVLKIDSILIDAASRKTFILDTSSGNLLSTYLIEGVGTSWGPLSGYGVFFEHATGLACFNHNHIPNTPAVNYPYVCEGYTVGIRKVWQNDFAVVGPNPFRTSLTVYTTCDIVMIADICGSPVQYEIKKLRPDLTEINLENCSSGVYFVTLKTPEGTITQKVIKQ